MSGAPRRRPGGAFSRVKTNSNPPVKIKKAARDQPLSKVACTSSVENGNRHAQKKIPTMSASKMASGQTKAASEKPVFLRLANFADPREQTRRAMARAKRHEDHIFYWICHQAELRDNFSQGGIDEGVFTKRKNQRPAIAIAPSKRTRRSGSSKMPARRARACRGQDSRKRSSTGRAGKRFPRWCVRPKAIGTESRTNPSRAWTSAYPRTRRPAANGRRDRGMAAVAPPPTPGISAITRGKRQNIEKRCDSPFANC